MTLGAKLSAVWLDRLMTTDMHRSNAFTVTVSHNSGPLAAPQVSQYLWYSVQFLHRPTDISP
jgi:hypothetical protein